MAANHQSYRDGVICKVQPCCAQAGAAGYNNSGGVPTQAPTNVPAPNGIQVAAAAGLPEYLWQTQAQKRKRDPSMPKLKRQRYTKEAKAQIMSALYAPSDVPVRLADVAKQFGLPEGCVRALCVPFLVCVCVCECCVVVCLGA